MFHKQVFEASSKVGEGKCCRIIDFLNKNFSNELLRILPDNQNQMVIVLVISNFGDLEEMVFGSMDFDEDCESIIKRKTFFFVFHMGLGKN